MRPLSAERPKALLPTLDVPQLTWALAGLKAAGARRVWVNSRRARGSDGAPGGNGAGGVGGVNEACEDQASIAREIERAAAALDLDVRMSLEPEEPLGTAGALSKLRAELDETFLLVNADVASSVPLDRVAAAHRAAGAPATLVGIPTGNRADLVAEDGWVVELVDRGCRAGAGHIYAGIGVFEPAVLDHVPDGVSHLFDTVMRGLVRDGGGRGLAVFEWAGFWSDLVDPAAHLRVNLAALQGALAGWPGGAAGLPTVRSGPLGASGPVVEPLGDRGSVPAPLRPPGSFPGSPSHPGAALRGSVQRWDALAYVGPGAEVEGVELVHAVVGAGARVEAGTQLERCVVWDGAAVRRGVFVDAVLTPRSIVNLGAAGIVEDRVPADGAGNGPAARKRLSRRTR